MAEQIADSITFDQNGLVPAVIQDYDNGEVLMVAYMNRDALAKTLATGTTHFWSRSRKKMWLKGESSGHTQRVQEIRVDCDADCLLIKVDQNVAACHTGYRSCFYRRLDGSRWIVDGDKRFEEKDVYRS